MKVDLRDYIGRELATAIGLFLAALFGVWMFLYQPASQEAARLQQELSQETAQVQSSEADSAVLRGIRARIVKIESEISRHARRLPEQERLEDVVQQIFQTGDQSGITVKSLMQNGRWTKESEYVSIPLQIELEGGYQGIVSFLTRLERSPLRIFVVDDLSFQAVEGTVSPGMSPLLRGRIGIRTYYRG